MHEMGIALQIVETARSAIPAEMKTARVEAIHLKIGRLAAVVPESLNLCMEVVTKGTPMEGCSIHIEEIPVAACCRDCAYQWEAEETGDAVETLHCCPSCRSRNLEIISGRELNLVSLDLEE